MEKYLFFKDGSSDKFWQIITEGKSFKATYGRSGTAGVTQVKEFVTAEKCESEAKKLVTEKMKKGYQEMNSGKQLRSLRAPSNKDDYRTVWESLEKAENIQEALMHHFSYLSESKASFENLRSIVMHVKEISITKENELCLKLDIENLYLVATAPNPSITSKWPKTFQEYQKRHELITLTDRNNISDLTLGDTGTLDRTELAENMDSDKFKKVISPISEMSDWWIYHPTELNEFGEPKIYLVSHEDMNVSKIAEGSSGELFLLRCVELLGMDAAKENDKIPKSKNRMIKATPGDKFEATKQALQIGDNESLHLGFGTLSTLTISANKITKVHSIKTDSTLIFESDLKLAGDKFVVWNRKGASHIFEVVNQKIKIENTIIEDQKKPVLTASASKDKFYCYFEDSGFYERKITGGPASCFQKEGSTENLFIKHSAIVKDQLIFIGQKSILSFALTSKGPKELSKLKLKSSWPKILPLNDNFFFLVFETQSDATPAISVFESGQTIKKVSTFKEGENALCWQLRNNMLWVITEKENAKKTERRYFCSQFNWSSNLLELVREFEVDFQHGDHLLLRYLHVLENDLLVINTEGLSWRIPI